MRLGEILIGEGLVLPAHLERVLATQQRRRLRIGSLLVDAGLATADAVARALGRQRTVPAALERHLTGRDASLDALIPAAFARTNQVVALARSKDGRVVVAMRDPADSEVRAKLADLLGARVIAAVACELILARHVARAYPTMSEGIDVEFETSPIAAMLDPNDDGATELDLGDIELGPPTDILDPETVRAEPAHVGFLDPESIRVGALVSLDDLGVTRDPRQSDSGLGGARRSGSMSALAGDGGHKGAVAPAMVTPPPAVPPGAVVPVTTPPPAPVPPGAVVPVTTSPPAVDGAASPRSSGPPPTVSSLLARIATATSRSAVVAAVIEHGRSVVDGLVVFAVRQGMLFGDAGFGPDLTPAAIEAVTLPLSLPSVLKTAVDAARPYAGRPPVGSSIQDRLVKLLGKPAGLVVAPIVMSGRVVGLIVAACPSVAAADAAAADLVALAGACGVAYARLRS